MFVIACGLSGTDKIVDECSTDYIYYIDLLFLIIIRNKKILKTSFLKHVLIRSVVSASAQDYYYAT